MEKKDHLFLVIIDDKINWAFCPAKEDKEEVKVKVTDIIRKKQQEHFQVHYLGIIDFENMDESFLGMLHLFEKHGSIWLLLSEVH